MTYSLKKRQKIIQEKRKNTPFRQYLLEIASWFPLHFYRNQWYISRYPETERTNTLTDVKTYEEIRNEWWWIAYSWSFMNNFKTLINSATLPAMVHGRWATECEYADAVFSSSSVYLSSTVVDWCSNVLYSISIKHNCHDVLNSMMVWDNCSVIYQSVWVIQSSQIFYSIWIENCSDMRLSKHCIWSHHCIRCEWLQNTSYAIDNIIVGKERFMQEKAKLLQENDTLEEEFFAMKSKASLTFQCENVKNACMTYRVQWWNNLLFVWGPWGDQEVYDMCVWWWPWVNHVYWCMAWWDAEHMYCCIDCDGSSYNYYCYNTENSNYCIWCVWLKNKEYCILNKQYSKEERYILAEKIFAELDKKWTLWNWFPTQRNPYYLNDTPAGMLLDIDKKEAESLWFLRSENPESNNKERNITTQESVFIKKRWLAHSKYHWLKRMQYWMKIAMKN